MTFLSWAGLFYLSTALFSFFCFEAICPCRALFLLSLVSSFPRPASCDLSIFDERPGSVCNDSLLFSIFLFHFQRSPPFISPHSLGGFAGLFMHDNDLAIFNRKRELRAPRLQCRRRTRPDLLLFCVWRFWRASGHVPPVSQPHHRGLLVNTSIPLLLSDLSRQHQVVMTSA